MNEFQRMLKNQHDKQRRFLEQFSAETEQEQEAKQGAMDVLDRIAPKPKPKDPMTAPAVEIDDDEILTDKLRVLGYSDDVSTDEAQNEATDERETDDDDDE